MFTWNNKKCIEIASLDYFPSHVKNISIQKEIITQFIDFYVGGHIRKGLSPLDIIFAAISVMPFRRNRSEYTYMWPEREYREDGSLFFGSPQELLKFEIQKIKKCTQNHQESTVSVNEVSSENSPSSDGSKQTTVTFCKEELKMNQMESNEPSTGMNINCEESNTSYHNDENKNKQDGESVSDHETRERDFIFNDINFQTVTKRDNRQLTYSSTDSAAFNICCNKLLETWDTSQTSQFEIKYFCGFIALTLLRATCKGPKYLMSVFSSERYLLCLRSLIEWKYNFCIPHKKCLKISYRFISQGTRNLSIMFAKIVLYAHIEIIPGDGTRFKIFEAAVLKHTANHGFGLINMLSTLYNHLNSTQIQSIYERTLCKDARKSWQIVHKFMDMYMRKTSKHFLYHWARIIDHKEFKILSCTQNFELAVMLAAIVDAATVNSSIWDSPWVKSGDEDKISLYKNIALGIYEDIKNLEKRGLQVRN